MMEAGSLTNDLAGPCSRCGYIGSRGSEPNQPPTILMY